MRKPVSLGDVLAVHVHNRHLKAMIYRLCCIAVSVGMITDDVLAQTVPARAGDPDIIVAGERIDRSIQETASSIAIMTSDDIAQRSAATIDQLLASIPNVQLGSGGEGPTIRGQDSTGALRDISAFLGGTRPRLTLQVDGRAISYYEYVFGTASTWDVAQVEVFRSPQTTTQGRNSVAGAVFVRTNDPTSHWEGAARATAGNYGLRQGSAMISGPIVPEQVAFRVAGDIRRIRNSSDMVDEVAGANLKHDDYGVARVKLLAQPAALPGLRIETAYVHGESQAPQFEAVFPPFEVRRAPQGEITNGVYRINTDSLTVVADYEFTRALASRTTLSWGDALVRRFGLPGFGRTRVDSRDFAIESTLNWQPGRSMQMVGGVYHLSVRQKQAIDVTGLGLGTGDFSDWQTSLGLFGEATWRPLPALAVTGGLRYQRDRQAREGVLRRPGAPGLLDYDRRFDAWLPKLSVALDLGRDVTVGLLTQRAFNPGGVTIVQLTLETDEFAAETLWNYEAFLRAGFAGGRGTLRANLFYNDITGAQRSRSFLVALPAGPPRLATEIVNTPAAESYGAEFDFGWRATNRLSLSLGVGLLETKILRTLSPNDPLLGKRFQRSPNASASATIDWQPVDGLRISAQARKNSGYFSDDANTPALRIEGSTVVNARAAWTHGGLTVFGYARNLFDRFYLTYLFPAQARPAPLPPRPIIGAAADPREIGFGIETRF